MPYNNHFLCQQIKQGNGAKDDVTVELTEGELDELIAQLQAIDDVCTLVSIYY